MQKNPKITKLSFLITPNEQGYLIACNEIPYLFTDAKKVEEINDQISKLVTEYLEYFPDDALKRGIHNGISTLTAWKGKPNSVALE